MARWPDTLLEPKPEVNVMGAKTHESGGVLFPAGSAVHKAATENNLAPGRATRLDVGGFLDLLAAYMPTKLNNCPGRAVG
eukprot:9131732-Heterocapsa_arctica.AAC.1